MARYPDGISCTSIDADPSGRIAIEGYDGELLVHRTTYSVETAEDMAADLADAVARIREAR